MYDFAQRPVQNGVQMGVAVVDRPRELSELNQPLNHNDLKSPRALGYLEVEQATKSAISKLTQELSTNPDHILVKRLGEVEAIRLVDSLHHAVVWRAGVFHTIDRGNFQLADRARGTGAKRSQFAHETVESIAANDPELRWFRALTRASLSLLEQSCRVKITELGADQESYEIGNRTFIKAANGLMRALSELDQEPEPVVTHPLPIASSETEVESEPAADLSLLTTPTPLPSLTPREVALQSYTEYSAQCVESGLTPLPPKAHLQFRIETIEGIDDLEALAEILRCNDTRSRRDSSVDIIRCVFARLSHLDAEPAILDLMKHSDLSAYWGSFYLKPDTLFSHLMGEDPIPATAKGIYSYAMTRPDFESPRLGKQEVIELALKAPSALVRTSALHAMEDRTTLIQTLSEFAKAENKARRSEMGSWSKLAKNLTWNDLLSGLFKSPSATISIWPRITLSQVGGIFSSED